MMRLWGAHVLAHNFVDLSARTNIFMHCVNVHYAAAKEVHLNQNSVKLIEAIRIYIIAYVTVLDNFL